MIRSRRLAAALLTTALPALLPATLHAQQVEQITVPAAPRSPSAATLLGSTALATAGTASLGDVLQSLPSMGNQGVNNAQDDGGFGEYFIDLRNLNFDRTLVLVDGARFPLSGIQTDEAVDLNDIPLGFIDRVTVLPDGAQPRLGPDAVAGAVDITLKRDLQGVQASAYGSASSRGDGGSGEVSLVQGHDFAGGGNLTLGLDLLQRDPVLQSARPWSADPLGGVFNGQGFIGTPATSGGHAIGPGIDAVIGPGGIIRPFTAADSANTAQNRDLQGGLRRASALLAADRPLTGDITAELSLVASDRSATTLLPPQALGLTGTLKHPDGFVIPAGQGGNPFGVPVSLERLVSEAGPLQTTTSGPVWRAEAGLRGEAGPWEWSLTLNHGESLSRYTTPGSINLTHALQTAGALPCASQPGCVPADWFGPNSLSAAALAYIRTTAITRSTYAEDSALAEASRALATLPGGNARLTLGLETRQESGSTTPDAVTLRGDQAGPDAGPSKGAYGAAETYAVLRLPLAPGLSATAAGRATETTRYGGFLTSRAELTETPLPGLSLRALIAESRRPPAISESFLGITTQNLPVTDPCDATGGLRANPVVNANCLRQGLGANFNQSTATIPVASGGNASLKPERGLNKLLGVTWHPPALPFLTASVDWFSYRIHDAIDSLADTDPDLIPDLCAESATPSRLCGLITRVPAGGARGQISRILALDENAGAIGENGMDFALDLHLPETSWGKPGLSWQATWLLTYRDSTTGVPGTQDYAGTFPGLSGTGSYARLRARATLSWDMGPWSLEWTGRFISGAVAPGLGKAPDVLYQDVELTRRLGRWTLLAGVNNLADTPPPFLPDGETNTDTATYDVLGRLVWARVTAAF